MVGIYERQIGPTSRSDLLSQITATASDGVDGSLVTASSPAALTTITTTQEFIKPDGTGFSTDTSVVLTTITDPDQYATLTALDVDAPTTTSPSFTRSASSTSSSSSPSSPSSSTPDAAAIAGGVVGGLLGVVLVAIAIFLTLRRRRRLKREQERYEKPELDSHDVKPKREELEGSRPPRRMLEKQTPLVEMPANEEVRRKSPFENKTYEVTGEAADRSKNELSASVREV